MKVKTHHGLSAVLALALALAPLAAEAQQPSTPTDAQQQPQQSGTQVNPAQGPLEPVPTNQGENPLPEAPQAQQPGQTAPAQGTPAKPAPQTQNQTEPLGTATAPGVSTVGGGASKPAGTAIAPAKQRQYRSLLIKLGLIAGAGVAAGTVYALSRGTSSTPPNATRAGAATH
jgi:hypothetical protein